MCRNRNPHEIETMKAACMAHALELLMQPPQGRSAPQNKALVRRSEPEVQDQSPADMIAELRDKLQIQKGPILSSTRGGGGKIHWLPKNKPTICKSDAYILTVKVELIGRTELCQVRQAATLILLAMCLASSCRGQH